MFKLTGYDNWPLVSICSINGKKNPYRSAVEEATAATARLRHDMSAGGAEWVWLRYLTMEPGATDLESFATECFQALRSVWLDLGPVVREAVEGGPVRSSTGDTSALPEG